MDDKGREEARKRQEKIDRQHPDTRAEQNRIDKEYIEAQGIKGWLNAPSAERPHRTIPEIPATPRPVSETKKPRRTGNMSVETVEEAMHAATATGTALNLSYKTEIATIKDMAKNSQDETQRLAGLIDSNEGELDNSLGHMNDIETYFNELSAVLAANSLPHDKEDNMAVMADEVRAAIGHVRTKAEELKEKLEQATKLLDEAESLADEVMGLTDTAVEKSNELGQACANLMA